MGLFLRAWDYFLRSGNVNVYSFIYSLPQFPLFFVVQALWSLYKSRRLKENFHEKYKIYLKRFFVAFINTFIGREIAAIFLRRSSPIIQRPFELLIFLVLFILTNFFPRDYFYKAIKKSLLFLGILQGFNQARFFNLFLRNGTEYNVVECFLIASTLTLIDQYILIFAQKEKYLYENILVAAVELLCILIYYLLTHQTIISSLVGLHPIYIPSIFLSITLSSILASEGIRL